MGTLLVDTHPDLVAEWHPTKNGDLDIATLGTFSNKKVWWLHAVGGDLHEWSQVIRNRTYEGVGCQACKKKGGRTRRFHSPAPGQSLADRHPQVAARWNSERNGALTARDVGPGTRRSVWWRCACGHEWIRRVNHEVHSDPVRCACTPSRREIGVRVPASPLSEKRPDIAAQWHPTKNGDLLPGAIGALRNQKAWWLGECGHSWRAYVHLRVQFNTGCPKCKKVTGSNLAWMAWKAGTGPAIDLASRFPEIAAEWHPTRNGDLRPQDVSVGSGTLVWWLCAQGHEWQKKVTHRTQRPTRCWACTYPVRVPDDERRPGIGESLAERAPAIAAWWDTYRNGSVTAAGVILRSKVEAWWVCPDGHRFKATPASRVSSQSGCRRCENRAERLARAA